MSVGRRRTPEELGDSSGDNPRNHSSLSSPEDRAAGVFLPVYNEAD